jgi:hypothetical protein
VALRPAYVDFAGSSRLRERARGVRIEWLKLEVEAVVARSKQRQPRKFRPRGRKDHQPQAGRKRQNVDESNELALRPLKVFDGDHHRARLRKLVQIVVPRGVYLSAPVGAIECEEPGIRLQPRAVRDGR